MPRINLKKKDGGGDHTGEEMMSSQLVDTWNNKEAILVSLSFNWMHVRALGIMLLVFTPCLLLHPVRDQIDSNNCECSGKHAASFPCACSEQAVMD